MAEHTLVKPLLAAIQNDSPSKVQRLLARRAPIQGCFAEETPLSVTLDRGSSKMVAMLLEAKANPEEGYGTTPLCQAIALGRSDLVEQLLASNADINRGQGGALTAAIKINSYQMLQLVICKGADINNDNRGVTALNLALIYGYSERALQLIAAGCDLNARTGGMTPFERAIVHYEPNEVVIYKLLSCGADLNTTGMTIDGRAGLPPLFYAALDNRPSLLEAMISCGAEPNLHHPWLTAVDQTWIRAIIVKVVDRHRQALLLLVRPLPVLIPDLWSIVIGYTI